MIICRSAIVLFLVLGWSVAVWAQEFTEPVVARAKMRFRSGEEVVDEIDKGDLLTVLQERDDAYLVNTPSGKQGWIQKANAVKLSESIEIYNELLEANATSAENDMSP